MYSCIAKKIEIDRTQRTVRKNGKEIHLTKTEFDLLDFFSAHANRNRICSRDEIVATISGNHFKYDTGTVDVHLSALRRKMGWSISDPLETIRGLGFVFRMKENVVHYTLDLQTLLIDWLHGWEAEMRAKGLSPQLHLTPFVNEMTLSPDAIRQLLDGVMQALLPSARPGHLTLSSQLTMDHFSLSLDINGTVSELKFPVKETSE